MKNLQKSVDSLLITILNIGMLFLALIMAVLLVKELWQLVNLITFSENVKIFDGIVEKVLAFFLYFEFIVLVRTFFKNEGHIPLQYFIYIAITAILRVILTAHGNSMDVLGFGATILLLVIGLKILPKEHQ